MITILQKYNKKIIIALISVFLLIGIAAFILNSQKVYDLSNTDFNNLQITKMQNAYIKDNVIYFDLDKKSYSLYASNENINKILKYTSLKIKEDFDYTYLFMIFISALFLVFLYTLRKNLNINSLKPALPQMQQNSTSQYQIISKTDTDFSKVIGQETAKKELKKIASQLKQHSQCFTKGILLTGPSGVGKTMLARALATECNVNFFYQSASSFNEMFVGLGAKRVRDLFNAAKERTPCIIFIDEIDALGKQRGNAFANDSENTLNELLTQIDGFCELNNVILIAATNRDDVLDTALLRRFDKKIHFRLPNYEERKIFLKNILGSNYNEELNYLAKISHGFSGSHFKSLENELINNKPNSKYELYELIINIKHGFIEREELNDFEIKVQALYQAGKIFISKLCGVELIFANLFIIDSYNENENIKSLTNIKNEIKIALAGMITNELIFNDYFNNFNNDKLKIEKLINFHVEINLQELEEECKQFIKTYKEEIEEIANTLIQDKKIFFKDTK